MDEKSENKIEVGENSTIESEPQIEKQESMEKKEATQPKEKSDNKETSFSSEPQISKEEEEELLSSIEKYYGGPYKDINDVMHDISYTTWVEQDVNIKKLCTPFEIVLSKDKASNNPFGVLSNHDFGCELKLIKWITEDEKHKNSFMKIGNNGAKINRHNDILPYVFNAVPLDLQSTEKNLDNYINASFIDGPFKSESKLFIATQGPLKETIPSFWKMIYHHKIKLVIMLSSPLEESEGRNVVYWPVDKEHSLKINNELEVKQIHVYCWPDHGLPNDENLANQIVEKMIEYIKIERKGENKSPVVVHCSAGVGRTGTLIAIYIIIQCLEELKRIKKPLTMNVFNVVRKLREQRYSLVTDKDQYKFIYDYSMYWIKKNYLNK